MEYIVAESISTDEERLKQLELDWNRAIEKNDVKEMAWYMADEWVIFSGNGNITTKERFLQSVKDKILVHTKMDFEILDVTVYGDTGIVMQRGISTGTWQEQIFDYQEISTTVFVKKNDRWQALHTMLAPVPRVE